MAKIQNGGAISAPVEKGAAVETVSIENVDGNRLVITGHNSGRVCISTGRTLPGPIVILNETDLRKLRDFFSRW